MINDEPDDSNEELQPSRFPYDGWDEPSPSRDPNKVYSPHYKGDNSGGFGNPPVSGQRKKGQPGGPGRPKGSTSLQSALRKAFRRRLPIVRDGRLAKLHPADILAERIIEAMLAKNLTPSMIELAQRLMERYGPQPAAEPELRGNLEGFSREERKVLGALIGRYIGDTPGKIRRSAIGSVSEPYPVGEFRLYVRQDGHLGLQQIISTPILLPSPDVPRVHSLED